MLTDFVEAVRREQVSATRLLQQQRSRRTVCRCASAALPEHGPYVDEDIFEHRRGPMLVHCRTRD